ncbi:MAG TPA: PqqD family protein [Steroidobacter sp.]|jgi:hypothetical protein|nr:PqqD family protein [Steroidobacteraceae bacterium]HLS80583.1 PqqD family protein [Steroidobacter sp.]
MKDIQSGVSYVRAPQAPADPGAPGEEQMVLRSLQSDATPADALARIWELLETPQTVETICRVLTNEFDLPPASSTEGVRIVLSRLYREDLIQASPDA